MCQLYAARRADEECRAQSIFKITNPAADSRLLNAKSGRSAAEIARQLGIRAELLYVWGNRTRPPGAGASAGSPEELASENARLREEVERLREQRDILKKSLGILCEPPLRGLPRSKS